MKLSIVVPVYNEEESIEIFIKEVEEKTKSLPLEKIFYFVNDGSTDKTLKIIKKLAEKRDDIQYISFSRNFGKEAALLAGLEVAVGDFVTIMDVDLQDPPEILPEMFEKLQEGYDVVGTRRTSRTGEPPIRSFFAKVFYKIINKISKTQIVDGARDYRLMTRQVVESVLELQENNRFSKGLFSWVGYKVTYLDFENRERDRGRTSWSFWSLLRYSIDGFVNFSEIPLSIATFIGVFCFFISIILSIFFAVKTLIWGDSVQGFPTLVILILMLGGLQLLASGIIGKYLAKTFLEVKNRPNYIIKESNIKSGKMIRSAIIKVKG
ncbi:glycosyltransferase family 2 protein [Lactococcus lactis]|uniref:glycosyltransferase family 2 protein n=1 Tax=Lactococcus lactis TaxID=1358 RepID=UPI00071E473F|nr:glycosyltransferase family 2 protein [Lactococcus lactis]KST80479.1 Bactoprenol glucosyl transferase [Lactococcus lactis subsp. lactis]MCC4120875.1 glycosyltransferase family 2 protein [Lactococcus lactis]MCJ7967721.1 glycosyltransferase family 2 protein [Lactococcus lactis]MCT0447604.1 glycosyltransferase [Lactococcus lactis subsp. lactis]WDA68731.1 glycosyltransferase family 2 protein [Lactococcus lactis]